MSVTFLRMSAFIPTMRMKRSFSLTKKTKAVLDKLQNERQFMSMLIKSVHSRGNPDLHNFKIENGSKMQPIQNRNAATQDQISQKAKSEAKTSDDNSFNLPPIPKPPSDKESSEEATRNQAMTQITWGIPPLKSIYIKWEKYRRCLAFLSSENIKRFFIPYGPIERVVYCSKCSAIVVFKLIRSAYIASINAKRQFAMYNVNVMWLPDC